MKGNEDIMKKTNETIIEITENLSKVEKMEEVKEVLHCLLNHQEPFTKDFDQIASERCVYRKAFMDLKKEILPSDYIISSSVDGLTAIEVMGNDMLKKYKKLEDKLSDTEFKLLIFKLSTIIFGLTAIIIVIINLVF